MYFFVVTAFEIKKDVKFPYLDFSTVELRRAVLEQELAINRTFAPELYNKLIEKEGKPVLVMKRFDARSMLSWYVDHGCIDDQLSSSLAKTVAEAHWITPNVDDAGAVFMAGLGSQLAKALAASLDVFPDPSRMEFNALYENALRSHKPLLNQRSDCCLVRRCHGDEHCANIVILDGRLVLFDAIEYSEKIAIIDVLYDNGLPLNIRHESILFHHHAILHHHVMLLVLLYVMTVHFLHLTFIAHATSATI